MMRLVSVLLVCAAPAFAQEVVFSPDATQSCLERDGAFEVCIGASADLCMEQSPGGSSTVGMGACLWAEYAYWDDRLNAVYSTVMQSKKAMDAELKDLGSSAPQQAPALREMQRAWVGFRDALCEYERSWWGGGTGGGPATAACLMRATAQQALYLEAQEQDQ